MKTPKQSTSINVESAVAVKIALIVACSENGVIGSDGDLPWHLPKDLKHFMRSTKGHAVIMGRKTFDSLDKPLGGRLNIVVSSSMSIDDEIQGQVRIARSLDEAIEIGIKANEEFGQGRVWVAGGGEIYRQAIDRADQVVRTRVHCVAEGDVTFDELDPLVWEIEATEVHEMDESHNSGFAIEWWTRRLVQNIHS
ncbi:MAG: dihydrofolate reductase [Phycisphaerales bacterium]